MDVGSIKRWAGGDAANDNKKRGGGRSIVAESPEVLAEKSKIMDYERNAGSLASFARTESNDARKKRFATQAADLYRKAAALIAKYPGSSQGYAKVLLKKADEMDELAK